ncbi:MAG: DUF2313 domain-containing protein [Thermodesulfovibrionales bacterium]|nr:DUF2313 domain-containing protein [Thermodesulfovibrionales bacterium]
MSHKNVLKLLFPIDLGGDFEKDIELEGEHLDASQARAETLLNEMFPHGAYELLASWERVCGLTPGTEEPLQLRRDKVIRKLRELGGLSRAYFIQLAAAIGYSVTIEEDLPFMCGWSEVGVDPLNVEESIFTWRVNVAGQPVYEFRCGESLCGERLLWWPGVIEIENIFNELKPAHTFVYFIYE